MARRYSVSPWIFFIGLFGFIMWKLCEYHCFPDPRVLSKAQSQYYGYAKVKGSRGVIQDSKGTVLVNSSPVPSFAITPQLWSPSDAAALSGLIPESTLQEISSPLFKQNHENSKSKYFSLARKVPEETAEKIRALKLGGVHEEQDEKREYQLGRLMVHVLGYCGAENRGQAGIELAMDSALGHTTGYKMLIRHSDGRSRVIGGDSLSLGGGAAESGGAVVKLTIDARIQYVVEKYLNETALEHKAKWGAAVCVNPNTGAVLSMASWPSFDPDKRHELTNENAKNNVVGRVYEPGSTFKPIYMGIAMESGLVRANETFDCPARIKIADGTISEAYPKAMGRISTAELLIRSSNVGMAQIGKRSKPLDMYRTLLNWGFGKTSDIELKGTERGILATPGLWRGVIPANISIGQGFAVTPLHLIMGMSAVVNGGKLLSPYIIQEAADSRGEVVYRGRPNVVREVLTEETSAWLRRVMRETVVSGTGKKADTHVTEIAAKTGTAQIAEKGKYIKGRYVSSFIGFWPYDNPQYLMLLVIGEPSGKVYYGGELAAPAFKKIVEGMADLEIFEPQMRAVL